MMRTSVGFSAVGEGRSSAALIWVTSWFNLGNKNWFEQDFGKLTGFSDATDSVKSHHYFQ